MDKMETIRPIIIALSVAVLYSLLWIPSNYLQNTMMGLFIFLGFLFIPIAIPIVYGYRTGDKITSFLIGAVSLPLGFYFIYILLDPHFIMDLFMSSIPGGIACGLAGYFASKQRLAVAIGLGIVWILLFLRIAYGA